MWCAQRYFVPVAAGGAATPVTADEATATALVVDVALVVLALLDVVLVAVLVVLALLVVVLVLEALLVVEEVLVLVALLVLEVVDVVVVEALLVVDVDVAALLVDVLVALDVDVELEVAGFEYTDMSALPPLRLGRCPVRLTRETIRSTALLTTVTSAHRRALRFGQNRRGAGISIGALPSASHL